MQEVLYFVDQLMLEQTQKHLNDLQKAIIIGTLNHKTYQKIGEENHVSEDHVKKISSDLWHQLSDILGEKVKKKNLKWIIEKNKNFKSSIFIQNDGSFHKVNFCTNTPNHQSNSPHNHQENNNNGNNQPQFKEDLREIPHLNSFYGRREELTNLSNQILDQKSRLVNILGVSGIGKTAFTLQLIKQIKTNFNYLIYRSLNTLPTLTQITEDIINFISPESASKLKVNKSNQLSLLKIYLSKYHCLIILDDVQKIFTKGKLAGNYQAGYEDYGELFNIITQFAEQSCLILVSQELPLELVNLAENNPYYSGFLLTGLGASAKEILREKQLLDEDKWDNLIKIYEGNPFYLKIIARVIKELFAGSVNQFLTSQQPFLPQEIEVILRQQFNRLTDSEKEILKVLAQETEELSFNELKSSVKVADLLKNIRSLQRRNLVKKIQTTDNQIVFAISTILQEYLLN